MQPTLESFSPRSFLTKSLHEIAGWLQTQRVPTGESLSLKEDYSEVRQQFGKLSHRWHPLLTCQPLQRPHLTKVHRLAVEALEISKLIYAELENERQGQTHLAPKSTLERMLDLNLHLLDRVTAQLALVESTVTHAEDLHEAARDLVAGHPLKSTWLVGLARRIRLEMEPRQEVWQWMPQPGLKLSDCLEPRTWNSEPQVYATGIQTARLVAWLGVQEPQLADRVELLMVAALLEDLGFLRLERTSHKVPSALEIRHQDLYRKHPSLGAALAAGVGDYSIDLSFLIAQHHERLDGTGYPHGLPRTKQSRDVQLFACLVRFQELLSRTPAENASVESACYHAAFQLFLESAQGAWSTRATSRLIESLDGELPSTFDSALATGQPFLAETFLEKRWACHSGESAVPAPHFLFSRSKSFSRFAGRTISSNQKKSLRHDPKG